MKKYFRDYIKKKLSWTNLSSYEKFGLVNKWAIVALLGNLLTFFGSVFFLMSPVFHLATIEVFLGCGCFLTWCSFTRYFENTKDFNLISRTFTVAIPILMRTILGIAPTFVGFALLGMCLFWPYAEKFHSFSSSLYILYSVMNGDSIFDLFQGTTEFRFIFGQLYVYSFVFISMCFFQNIMFVVVEDSFMQVKY